MAAQPVLLSLAVLCLAGCNPDPTDPENVAPVNLMNDASNVAHIFWCLGRGTSHVQISSYEVLLRIKAASGPGEHVYEDDAPVVR
jgi:hypothetical protein